MDASRRLMAAHVAPFAIFMLGLMLVPALQWGGGPEGPFLLREPAYWVFPLQALVCAGVIAAFWRSYQFGSMRSVPLAVAVGLGVFGLWVSPQALFHVPARINGFDPTVFADQPGWYTATVAARFFRLVIVVPLVEEIFWRGFLQRYLVDERFTTVPFGKYTPLSFWGVALMFMFVHGTADWPAAFVTGAIYGWIAVRTRSLLACVVAHAVTNLALGLYIMATRQWGFW